MLTTIHSGNNAYYRGIPLKTIHQHLTDTLVTFFSFKVTIIDVR